MPRHMRFIYLTIEHDRERIEISRPVPNRVSHTYRMITRSRWQRVWNLVSDIQVECVHGSWSNPVPYTVTLDVPAHLKGK